MAIRNNHWYNSNEQRNYPLDDTASALSNEGMRLPSELITDLRIWWRNTYGKYAFISSATQTNHIVTFMIEATDDLDNDPVSSTLIAGLSIPKSSLVPGRTYSLETFQPGVGGFVSLGTGSDQPFRGLFNSPHQTLLTPRAARPGRTPPIPSVGIEQAETALKGLVNLTAVPPLHLTKETRVIGGVEYENVIVFRLQEEADNIETSVVGESVFSRFAGPCGRRVGSKSCVDPQPIETINGISADVDGVLTLDFRGCATIGRNVADCGVVIDCDLGLSDSCDPPYLPTLDTGELPSEVTPAVITPPPSPEPPVGPDVSISEEISTILSLPYCDTFDDGVAYGFSPTGSSLFGFISDDSPLEEDCCSGVSDNPGDGCTESQSVSGELVPLLDIASSYGAVATAAQSRTNISLFTSDVQTLYRSYKTDTKIVSGQTGSLRNAGVVLNYRLTPAGLPSYFLALLNLDDSTFGVYYFNGTALVELSSTTVPDVRTGDWYRIVFSALPSATQTSVNLTGRLIGVTDPSIDVTIATSVSSNLWDTDSGQAGLYSRRAKSYFSFWRVDEKLS